MLKGFFKAVARVFYDDRDPATIVDEFAQAAFKREGYVVQKRESVQNLQGDNTMLAGETVTYSLKKAQDDGQEYTGSVTSGLFSCVSPMHGHVAGPTVINHRWVNNDIKPKL